MKKLVNILLSTLGYGINGMVISPTNFLYRITSNVFERYGIQPTIDYYDSDKMIVNLNNGIEIHYKLYNGTRIVNLEIIEK